MGKKICLNATGYHPDQWKPSWSVKTLLIALSTFMVTEGEGAVGSVDVPTEIRKELALKSRNYTCPVCGMSHESLHKKWDKKKQRSSEEEGNGKGEVEQSPSEPQEISEPTEDTPEQQETETETQPTQSTEKLNPMEILRRRRASRMKQKEVEASQKLSAEGTETENRDNQEQDQEPQRTEENRERNGRETRPLENNPGGEEELILAPEEIIRNAILDKTVVLIILAIVFLALRKWVLSE